MWKIRIREKVRKKENQGFEIFYDCLIEKINMTFDLTR